MEISLSRADTIMRTIRPTVPPLRPRAAGAGSMVLAALIAGAPSMAAPTQDVPPGSATAAVAAATSPIAASATTSAPGAAEAAASKGAPLPAGVMVRINGQDILRSQFVQELTDVLGESYREAFVSHILVEQKAKALGIGVTSEEIDARVQENVDRVLRDNFGGDSKRMEDALTDRGMSLSGWKKRLAVDARSDLLLDKLVRLDRTITDEVLQRDFEEKYGPGGVQIKVRHILINVPVATSQEYTLQQFEKEKDTIDQESKARAEEALRKLNAGESFESVMAVYSDDPRKAMGGVMTGWKGRYGPDLDAAVTELKKGQHSAVVKCPDGYRIVECVDITENEEIHAEHILIGVGSRGKGRTEEEAEKLANALLARLSAGEDFGQLAKEYSDDPGSAARGGDLGWFGRRVMVKPFEEAAFSMAPGAISNPPIETTFGFHIIKVLEKRTNEERTVRQILVGTSFSTVKDRRVRPALEAKAMEEINALQRQLAQGASFADLAKAHSDDAATKAEGGLIKNYREGLYAGAFDEAVKTMKPGDPPRVVSDVSGNLHLVIVEEIQKTGFDQVKEAIRTEEMQRPPSAQEKNEYLASLRQAATIVW